MFTPSETESPLIPGDDEGAVHRRALAREFFASALYVALVLLAALVALPRDRLPTDHAVMATLFGTALGLVLAHLVAVRFAAHFTAEAGRAETPLIQEAGAGLGRGLAGGDHRRHPVRGLRRRRRPARRPHRPGDAASHHGWGLSPACGAGPAPQSLAAAGLALIAAMVVVYVKDFLGH